ncbi:acetyl-CoA synthetase [Nonomuraea harbinensis]|uniref:Acetyl-CoA synthetase n=1 Tax=Nonomuraea harbinensis TaxID=1286938 RepID=A0ABW1C983_9ACTN|nr:acetyl-CoA synthetase [Nonomuraea harbinensis]
MDPRTPCLIGEAQRTVREQPGPEPLDLWEETARAAAAQARLPVERLESIQIVHTDSWQYDTPTGRLAERLGATPGHTAYSKVSGTAPQTLIGEAAARIAAGELDSALITGAEALATRRAYRLAGEHAPWSHAADPRPPYAWERPPHPSELAHELFLPVHTYPIMETARRAALGHTIEQEMLDRGRMMAPMTRVAAANPHAWRRTPRTSEELIDGNRFVGWPYNRSTVAVIEVDQAAAVVLASTALADRLGVPADQRVYLRGWAYAEDTWEVAARPALGASQAVGRAAESAFARAGLTLDDMRALDVYSCFAIALRQACDAIKLDPMDPRGLTVTGGLPYAGGPASDYVLHSTATMAGLLRAGGGHGLVTGVGMHLTKHTYAIWSTEPGGVLGGPEPVFTAEPVPIADSYEGPAVVAGYTVAYDKDGVPWRGILVADLPSGARAYAHVTREELMADAVSRELVGQRVELTTDGKVNVASW